MKQIFHFDQFDPPVLNETILRRELEKRAERRRTVLLAVAGALFEVLFVLLGLLLGEVDPVLALGCFCFVLISAAGSGAIAIVYVQKGDVTCVRTC